MIEALLAKSCIENNEGMNHLLLKFSPTTQLTHVKLDINLPYGVNRQVNLNSIAENAQGSILFEDIREEKEILFELYTDDVVDVPLGDGLIRISLKYHDAYQEQEANYVLELKIIDEDDVFDMKINEEVLTKVKELTNSYTSNETNNDSDLVVKSKVIKMSNSYSHLEEKYRINY